MLLVLALPVIAAVTLLRRYLKVYAPSNVLIGRVCASTPRLRIAAVLVALAGALLVAMHAVAAAVVVGAPGWLYILVLLLAWDAIKFGWLALAVALRLLRPIRRQRDSSDA